MGLPQLEGLIHYSFGLAPVDVNGAANSDIINTQLYDRIDFVVVCGVLGGAITLTVEECDDTTPSNSTAIAFDYKKTTAASGDTFGAVTAATTSGITIAGTDDGKTFIIMTRAAELTEDFPYVRVVLSDPSAESFVCIVPVGYGARLMQDVMPTALT